MKIMEPAVDLGIIAAVASSFKNLSIPNNTVIIGEVRINWGN